jgi:hypothetical protein
MLRTKKKCMRELGGGSDEPVTAGRRSSEVEDVQSPHRGMIAAHSVYASTGRRGRRAEKQAVDGSFVEPGCGAQEELKQRVCASRDIASDKIGIFGLELGR